MSGVTLEFTESQLQASVSAYDPEVFKAPLVVGHPKTEDPAYGWVSGISFADGILNAAPDQVDPAFAEMVNSGKFPKVSASFYLPDSPNNPKPGVLYLKHVGFLGATAPAVKGLKTVSFSASDEGVVEFADWDQMNISGMFRNLREWIISQFGTDAADKALPGYQIDSLQISAAQDDDDDINAIPQYSESDKPMLPHEKAEMDRLVAENATLKTTAATLQSEVTSFAEAEKTRKAEVLHLGNVSFAEALVKEGKLLPAGKASTIAFMDHLATQESSIEFGEGETKVTGNPLDIYKKQLEALPKLVDFSEKASGAGGILGDVVVDASTIAAAAVEFSESETAAGRNVNSAEAVAHVKKQLGVQ